MQCLCNCLRFTVHNAAMHNTASHHHLMPLLIALCAGSRCLATCVNAWSVIHCGGVLKRNPSVPCIVHRNDARCGSIRWQYRCYSVDIDTVKGQQVTRWRWKPCRMRFLV